MGIRSERKLRREQEEKAKETAIPGGVALLPCGFVYDFCKDCEQNKSGIFDLSGDVNVNVNFCRMKCRKQIYSVACAALKGREVSSMYSVVGIPENKNEVKMQKCKAGSCLIKESCPNLVLILGLLMLAKTQS